MRKAAAEGYEASRLTLAIWRLAGKVDPGQDSEAIATLQALADSADAPAQNALGLRAWRQARTAEERREAITTLKAAAQNNSALAHENLAEILAAWPSAPHAARHRLYHLLMAARLYQFEGAKRRSRLLMTRAEPLSRHMQFDEAAGAARDAWSALKVRE